MQGLYKKVVMNNNREDICETCGVIITDEEDILYLYGYYLCQQCFDLFQEEWAEYIEDQKEEYFYEWVKI